MAARTRATPHDHTKMEPRDRSGVIEKSAVREATEVTDHPTAVTEIENHLTARQVTVRHMETASHTAAEIEIASHMEIVPATATDDHRVTDRITAETDQATVTANPTAVEIETENHTVIGLLMAAETGIESHTATDLPTVVEIEIENPTATGPATTETDHQVIAHLTATANPMAVAETENPTASQALSQVTAADRAGQTTKRVRADIRRSDGKTKAANKPYFR